MFDGVGGLFLGVGILHWVHNGIAGLYAGLYVRYDVQCEAGGKGEGQCRRIF